MDLVDLGTYCILFVCSFFASVLASLTGGGAGFIQFPLLIFMGLPFVEALGTHKSSMLLLGVGSFVKKSKNALLDPKLSLIMFVLGGPAVCLGTIFISYIPERTAEIILGIFTLIMAVYCFFSKSIKKSKETINEQIQFGIKYIIGAFLLVLIGFFSGALSSGAGLFVTLVLITFFKMDIKRAINHSVIFAVTYWNLVGAVTVGVISSIHWQWLPILLLASFIGGMIGTSILYKLQTKIVVHIFTAVLVISGLSLICLN